MSVATTQMQHREGLRQGAEPEACELSVVIVSYNVAELLRQCLRSVQHALEGIAGEILVVDNASEDGTVAKLRPEFPEVVWIELASNVGFGRANNIGIRRARGRYVLLLNPDTLVHPATLRTMLQYMEEHPEVGIAGCRVLNADGSFQETCRRGFPTPWAAFTRLFGLERLFPRSPLFARYGQRFRPEDEVGYAEVVSGAFMFCRREVLEQLGGFDSAYFLYGEDVDLCYRAHLAGWRIGYVGTATILHFKGESTRRSSVDRVVHFYDAMRIFVRRYYGRSPVAWLLYAGIAVRELLARAAAFPTLWLFGAVDVVGTVAALLLATQVRFGSPFGFPAYAYPTVFLVVGGVVLGLMVLLGDYLERRVQIARALLAYSVAFLVLASLTYFFKQYAFSRWVLIGTVVGGAVWGILVRMVVQGWLWVRQELAPRRIALLGTGPLAQAIAVALSQGAGERAGVVLVGFLRYRSSAEAEQGGGPILGSYDELPYLIERWRIHELVVAEPDLPPGEVVSMAERLARWRVRLYVVSEPDELYVQRFVQELFGYEPAWLGYPLLHPRIRLLKRCVDVAAALVALTFGLPLVFLSPRRGELLRRWGDVFRGRWSVVGIYPQEGESYGAAKPGLTGLAHLAGGAQLPRERVRQLNWYYIRHYSLALDMEIVLRHCVRRLRREARPGF